MYPYIGTLATYPIFFALGFIIAATIAAGCVRAAGVELRQFMGIVIAAALAMLVGGKIHSLLERGGPRIPISWELVYGYRYPGGLVAFVATLWLASRVTHPKIGFLMLADAFAPALGFAIAIIRIGCFLSGCCFGKICDLPWAVQFPAGTRAWHAHVSEGLIPADAPLSLPVHPAQLYIAGYGLLMGLVLLRAYRHRSYDGQVFLMYLLLHGLGLLGFESVRYDGVLLLQMFAVIMAVVGSTGLLLNRTRHRRALDGVGSRSRV